MIPFGDWLRVFVFIFSIFFFSASSFAQSKEQSGPPAPNGKYEVFFSSASLTFATSLTRYDLSPGLNYSFFPWLQLGGETGFVSNTYRGAATYYFQTLVGPTFNFGSPTGAIGDAYHMSLGVAWRFGQSDTYDMSTKDPDGLGFYFIVGKRFPLFGALCFRPTIGMAVTGTSAFMIRPIAISIVF